MIACRHFLFVAWLLTGSAAFGSITTAGDPRFFEFAARFKF